MDFQTVKDTIGVGYAVSRTVGDFGFDEMLTEALGIQRITPSRYYVKEHLLHSTYTGLNDSKQDAIQDAKEAQKEAFDRAIDTLTTWLENGSKSWKMQVIPSYRRMKAETEAVLEAIKNYDLDSIEVEVEPAYDLSDRTGFITDILPVGTPLYLATTYNRLELEEVTIKSVGWGAGYLRYNTEDSYIEMREDGLHTSLYGQTAHETLEEAEQQMSDFAKAEITKYQGWVK